MPKPSVHMVGGAVRDALLGKPVHDRDWVVVGARPEDLLRRGFLPVGKDFPVFLHPHTHEEYALARTERKSAPGYRGFAVHAAPDITLEQDLARRDLTVNAIATAALPGGLDALHSHGRPPTPGVDALIDPYGGVSDLRAGVLRHIGPAFAEDPVRILRLARFAARWPHFTVHDDTLALCRRMVRAGEVAHLVPERVWQELSRGLMQAQPSRFFQVLRDCEALAALLPELDRLWGVPQRADHHPEVDTGVHTMMVIDMAARLQASLPVRLACLFHDLGKGTTPAHLLPRHHGHEQRSAELVRTLSARWRVPRQCQELAEIVAREHAHIHGALGLSAPALLRLLQRCDALRRPERFDDILLACECDARGRLGLSERAYPQRAYLHAALRAVQAIDAEQLAHQLAEHAAQTQRPAPSGAHIAQALQAAREAALYRLRPEA